MHGARARQRFGPDFGETDPAHLAGAYEVGHRADRFLDRHARIDAVQVVEIDRIDAEPLQASVAGLANALRAPVDLAFLRIARIAHDAELRREHDLVAA